MRLGIFLLVAFAFGVGVEAGFLDRLAKIHDGFHALRDVVHNTVYKFAHDPNSTITAKLFPEAVEMLHKRALRLEQCYNSKIGGKEINIFKMPLGEFIHKVIEVLTKNKKQAPEVIAHKIENLVRTAHELVKSIVACVRNDDPKFLPTKLGFTHFSEMPVSMRQMYLQPLPKMGRKIGEDLNVNRNDEEVFPVEKYMDVNPPETYDYRDQGVVSRIKNQGYCGTCFAFGTMASIESSYMLQYNKKNISFNEKATLNCMLKGKQYEDMTCHKGCSPEYVYAYARTYGLVYENEIDDYSIYHHGGKEYFDDYLVKHKIYDKDGKLLADGKENYTNTVPYDFHPDKCDLLNDAKVVRARVKSYLKQENLPDVLTLKKIIHAFGPVATNFIAIDAFLQLSGGEWNDPCYKKNADGSIEGPSHVMLIVGWTKDHWIIKNSYGDSKYDSYDPWGKKGYGYVHFKQSQSCAIIGPQSKIMFPIMQ